MPFDALDDLIQTVPKAGAKLPRAVAPAAAAAPAHAVAPVSSFDLTRDAPKIKDAFRTQFGHDLPVSAFGQTQFHKSLGRDHSADMDVALDPTSTGGKWLIGYLKENGIAHIPQYHAGKLSTGAHIHVGQQSRKLDALDDVLDQVPVSAAPAEPAAADAPASDGDELDKLIAGLPAAAAGGAEPADYTVNSSASVAPPAPASKPPTFNPYTVAGRASRDAAAAAERQPNAVRSLRVQLPAEWSRMTPRDVATLAVDAYAKAEGVPQDFAASWLKAHAEVNLYDPHSGKPIEIGDLPALPSFDSTRRTLDVGAQMPQLSKLKSDYEAQRPLASHALDSLTDDRTTAGEKAGGVVSGVVAPVLRPVGRALTASSSAVAGQQRAAGAMLAAPFSESARDVLSSGLYDPQVQAAAALNTLKTGNVTPGYEQPIAEGADLLSQMYTREHLSPLARTALEIAGDPLTYAPLEGVNKLGAGALSRLSEFGGRVASDSRAGRLVSRVARVFERANDPRLDEVFERGGRILDLRPVTNDADHIIMRLEDGSHVRVNTSTGEYVELGDAPHHSNFQPREAQGTFAPGAPARPQIEVPPAGGDELDKLLAGVPRSGEGTYALGETARAPLAGAQPPSLLRRAGSTAADILNLPKAVRASYDLSAVGRQGLPQVLAHPLSIKAVMRDQVKSALSEDAFKSFVSEITSRPDYRVMQESGLFLSSPRGVGLSREEVYASRLSEHIPGVAASDRAYSTALDRLRVNAWDLYTKKLAGKSNVGKETYKAAADLINISTGRGVVPILDRSALGRKIVNILNVPFFSPRTMASRFNLLSPRRLIANAINPATRPVALIQAKEGFRALTTLSVTLGLLDNIPGVDVGWSPFKSNFGKVKIGSAHYDLTGGTAHAVRVLAQLAHSFAAIERGEKLHPTQTPVALTTRFLRSQLSPTASVATDAVTGKNFAGKPFSKLQAAADLTLPMTLDSFYQGWVDAGGSTLSEAAAKGYYGVGPELQTAFAGGARALPDVGGVPAQFYDESEDIEAKRAAARVNVGGRAGEELKRLGIDLNFEGHHADKHDGQFKSLPSQVASVVDGSVSFGGNNPGQTPQQLDAARRAYERKIAEAVEREISKPGYAMFKTDAARRQYLQGVVATVRGQTVRGFNRETRGREIDELQRIKGVQNDLERRSGTSGVRHMTL